MEYYDDETGELSMIYGEDDYEEWVADTGIFQHERCEDAPCCGHNDSICGRSLM